MSLDYAAADQNELGLFASGESATRPRVLAFLDPSTLIHSVVIPRPHFLHTTSNRRRNVDIYSRRHVNMDLTNALNVSCLTNEK